jgi:hypothetical protein
VRPFVPISEEIMPRKEKPMSEWKANELRKEEKKHLVPMDYDFDTKEIGVPQEVLEEVLLDDSKSKEAHGTSLNSLKLMEALIMSGRLSKIEMIKLLTTLAEYQFIKASSNRQPVQKEKTVEDYLAEIADADQSGES